MAQVHLVLLLSVTIFVTRPNINSCSIFTNDYLENVASKGSVLGRDHVLTESRPEDHPYAVMLLGFRIDALVNLPILCSGTLITHEHVLTAGHCVYVTDEINNEKYYNVAYLVYAGGNNLKELSLGRYPPGAQALWSTLAYSLLGLKKNAPHDYDLGIVKVGGGGFATNVNILKRIIFGMPYYMTHYKRCIVTGFGEVQIGENNILDGRRKTQEVEIIDMDQEIPCGDAVFSFLKYDEPRKWYIPAKPKENIGLCRGDSGAALICDGFIRGVASYFLYRDLNTCLPIAGETKCATTNNLVMYIDPCKFYDYIEIIADPYSYNRTHLCSNPEIFKFADLDKFFKKFNV